MRVLLAVLAIVLLAATSAAARPSPVTYSVTPTLPSSGCTDCVGVAATVATTEPENCIDCGGVGAGVGVQHDGDGTTVSALVCRGGFVYICPVDQSITL